RSPAGAPQALHRADPRRPAPDRPDGAAGEAPRLHPAPEAEGKAHQVDVAMTVAPPAAGTSPEVHEDPRRWITLAIVVGSAFIVVLDTTVLNVAIPTIMREFHTTLPSLEWVITGYALTFATLLIIGGRLGDVYGHRRVFVIGAALFGAGSFLASISHSVGM